MDRMESEGGGGGGGGFPGGFPGGVQRGGQTMDFAEFFSNFGAFGGGFPGFNEVMFETPVQLSFMVGAGWLPGWPQRSWSCRGPGPLVWGRALAPWSRALLLGCGPGAQAQRAQSMLG
jgi:hypothetical protein